jgi:hypothetical protein
MLRRDKLFSPFCLSFIHHFSLKVNSIINESIGNHYCRFWHGSSATDQMFCFGHILEKKNESMDCAPTIYRLQESLRVRREVLYSNFIEFGIPMKLVWLIKLYSK